MLGEKTWKRRVTLGRGEGEALLKGSKYLTYRSLKQSGTSRGHKTTHVLRLARQEADWAGRIGSTSKAALTITSPQRRREKKKTETRNSPNGAHTPQPE